MSRRRPDPPPGYMSTGRAAELLHTSDSYVRRLAREPTGDGQPVLASVVLRSDGGGEYRYVLLSDVEKFRNARLRRAGGGDTPAPLAGLSGADAARTADKTALERSQDLTGSGDMQQVGVSSTDTGTSSGTSDQGLRSGAVTGADWQLELDLATANARLNEIALRVEALERLNEQLKLENTRLQRRLGELARAQMQLLDGYLVNEEGT